MQPPANSSALPSPLTSRTSSDILRRHKTDSRTLFLGLVVAVV